MTDFNFITSKWNNFNKLQKTGIVLITAVIILTAIVGFWYYEKYYKKDEKLPNRNYDTFKLCIKGKYTDFKVSEYKDIFKLLQANTSKILDPKVKEKIRNTFDYLKSKSQDNSGAVIDLVSWCQTEVDQKTGMLIGQEYLVIFASNSVLLNQDFEIGHEIGANKDMQENEKIIQKLSLSQIDQFVENYKTQYNYNENNNN